MSTLLDLRNISISFGGVHAVRNVNFQVEEGEIIGLIGPNGSGKSTCVNLISGAYTLDAGEIYFDGKLLTRKDKINDRSQMGIGRTFQTPKPFGHMTVYNNVYTIALQKNDFEKAAIKTIEILKKTKLDTFSNMTSSKLPIEKRKWLDLARILATDPKFIMMDEVMAGLNQIEMAESIELVRKINKEGVTILFIEHVLKAVVSICTKVVVLNEGQVLYIGTPREALKTKEVIEAYIGGANKNAQY